MSDYKKRQVREIMMMIMSHHKMFQTKVLSSSYENKVLVVTFKHASRVYEVRDENLEIKRIS